tara:strand:- start:254 stop:448 length:195 start_codon:yes stop_codon:yes gene_type:complete
MTTIIIKTDEELTEAIKKYGIRLNPIRVGGVRIVDERPNNNKDQELERHIDAVEEERIDETGQL